MIRKVSVKPALRAMLCITMASLALTSCASKKDKSPKKTEATVTSSKDAQGEEKTKASEKETENLTEKATEKETEKATEKETFAKVDPVAPKATVPQYSYEATKIGSCEINNNVSGIGGFLRIRSLTGYDNEVRIYLPDGTLFPKDGEGYLASSDLCYIGEGYSVMRKVMEGNPNTMGLMTTSGEVLIPFDAACIDWIYTADDTIHRYLRVGYATEKTVKDEAFVGFTKDKYPWLVSEDEEYYKGYVKVYDTVTRKFVTDNLTNSRGYHAIFAVGDSFVYEDEDRKCTLYNSDGKALLSNLSIDYTDGNVLIINDNDTKKHTVYNSAGEKLWISENYLYNPQGGILNVLTGSRGSGAPKGYAVDYAGNRISDNDFIVERSFSGMLLTLESMGELIHPDGTQILDYATEVREIIPGYIYYKDMDRKYCIATADGELCSDCAYDEYEHLVVCDDDGKYYVWNDKSYSLQLEKTGRKIVGEGLIVCDSTAYGRKNLYDLFTGNKLLGKDYEWIYVTGDHVYAYDSVYDKDTNKIVDVFDVYELTTNIPFNRTFSERRIFIDKQDYWAKFQ